MQIRNALPLYAPCHEGDFLEEGSSTVMPQKKDLRFLVVLRPRAPIQEGVYNAECMSAATLRTETCEDLRGNIVSLNIYGEDQASPTVRVRRVNSFMAFMS